MIKEIFENALDEKCVDIEKLCGGVTNSSYSIKTNLKHYVMRVPGKGTNEYINRQWEIANLKELSKLNLSPKIFYANEETGVIITEYLEGNIPMSKNCIYNPNELDMICDSLAKLHNSTIEFTNEFDLELTKNSYVELLKSKKATLPKEFVEYIPVLDDVMKYLFFTYPKELVPCHGDPKLNNFLFQKGKIWMIDLEYSGRADRYFDLVNMAMTNNLNELEEKLVLDSYEKQSNQILDRKKYLLYKICTDYLWIYWHLIKLQENEMIEYNEKSWKNRLDRALCNLKILTNEKLDYKLMEEK